MKYFIIACVMLSIMACTKPELQESIDSFLDCDQIADNYKVYNGEEITCEFHFVLTEYNDEQFIELRAHCADLTRSFVFNKNCEDICEVGPYDNNSECGKYLNNRVVGDILFISK